MNITEKREVPSKERINEIVGMLLKLHRMKESMPTAEDLKREIGNTDLAELIDFTINKLTKSLLPPKNY